MSLYSLCVNNCGVVETSDVCLDCHTVIDRDVDLNRLLLWCLEKKSCKMLNAYFSPFFVYTLVQSEVCRRGENLERDNITYCTLKDFVWRRRASIVMTNGGIEEESTDVLSFCSRMFTTTDADGCSLSGRRVKRNVVLKVLLIHFKDTCDQRIS